MDARIDHLESRMDRFEVRLDGLIQHFETAIRDQTRFFVTCVFAAMAGMTAVFGLIVHV